MDPPAFRCLQIDTHAANGIDRPSVVLGRVMMRVVVM